MSGSGGCIACYLITLAKNHFLLYYIAISKMEMERDILAVSKAAQKATEKYDKKNYDRILVKFPKGTKEKIKETGETVNGFINKAVSDRLKEQGKS